MAEVTEAALANRKKQVILWGCCCDSVVLASDYVQAATVKPVHTAHHWLSEGPCVRCVCQRRTHSKLVRPQLQCARQPVVCPYAGERAECSLCDGHAITNVSVVSAIALHSRPQILERVDVLERSVASVSHLIKGKLLAAIPYTNVVVVYLIVVVSERRTGTHRKQDCWRVTCIGVLVSIT